MEVSWVDQTDGFRRFRKCSVFSGFPLAFGAFEMVRLFTTFARPVLGCIDADFSDYTIRLQHFSELYNIIRYHQYIMQRFPFSLVHVVKQRAFISGQFRQMPGQEVTKNQNLQTVVYTI